MISRIVNKKFLMLFFFVFVVSMLIYFSNRVSQFSTIPASVPASQVTVIDQSFREFPAPDGTICQCPKDTTWVCGTDYLNYSSSCEASCYGVDILYQGECRLYEPAVPIPSHCPVCADNCKADEVRYLDDQNCPSCICNSAPGHTDTESEDEESI